LCNQKTGEIGEVIGFGHQILDSGYTTTLKVLVASEDSGRKRFVTEDLYSAWTIWSDK
jgi:hypothetical protein